MSKKDLSNTYIEELDTIQSQEDIHIDYSDIPEFPDDFIPHGKRFNAWLSERSGQLVVIIPPDLAQKFPSQTSVTNALRWILENHISI